ncbi:MAG: FAD-binding oxidoreductase [Candidatus Latescibacteria bacterium]|nr:FAD-binding oxidoreductase [Candidatus Latescibacterota bacterium]
MHPPTTIIIGGGVTGLSTAYHLALKKFGRIILLDKGPVGDGSSSRSAGIITGLLWSETGVRARQISLQRFRELSQELEGYQFQDVGSIILFDPPSWTDREKLLPLYERVGAPFEILDATEMRRRWPALHPREDLRALYDPLGGYSEPDEYLPALARKCRELGVEIREHQQVTDVLTRGGRVTGVRTPEGDIEGIVVCTVYAWTRKLLERIGLRLPVKSFVHQRYVTTPLPSPVRIPVVNANPYNGYIRPASGNRLLVGIETSDREEHPVPSLDFHMSALSAAPELRDQLMRDFVPLVPDLGALSWATERVGLLTFSMDGEPILGPVAGLPGLYVGVAFHSGGFAYNPASGLLLAEFVADGRTRIDLAAFSPDRFDPREVDQYLATTVPQSHAFQRRH